MKKNVILLFVLFMAHAAFSQNSFQHELLKEGRTWNLMELVYPVSDDSLNSKKDTTYFQMTVKGDTIIDGMKCKKILQTTNAKHRVFHMYEDDGQLFSDFMGTWQQEFDFRLQPGDKFLSQIPLNAIETIGVNNELYRRFVFSIIGDYCWIEGIGSSMFGPLSGFSMLVIPDGYYKDYYTLSVFDGDECVFKYDDFFISPITNGIGDTATPGHGITYYDLQGRRVGRDLQSPTGKPQRRGLYIRDGKKVVIK